MRSKQIKGVLHNLLGSYGSRNSDYKGYWLFGFLVAELDEMRIDLLNPKEESDDKPSVFAEKLAIRQFRKLIGAGAAISNIKEASLSIKKLPGYVGGRMAPGHTVQLLARVVFQSERAVEVERRIFVAVHNPLAECRRVGNS